MTPPRPAQPARAICGLAALALAAAVAAGPIPPIAIPADPPAAAAPVPAAPQAPAAPTRPQASARFTWPTPNNAFLEGRPLAEFIQPTESGEVASGTFGDVRNGGRRFHEGVDLKPIRRDRRGEAEDVIVAVADGVVRHVNARSGESNYGRYVVLEHPDLHPPVYTLYAHLASLPPGLRAGQTVRRGEILGIMGRSASGVTIPPSRAHLHFEIGLRLGERFDLWYSGKGFGSPNRHGDYNGMNLSGMDPLAFFTAVREGRVRQPLDFIRSLPVAVRLFVSERRTPSFARRYPELVQGEVPLGGPAGWEVDLFWTGLPLALRPVATAPPGASGRCVILSSDPSQLRERCVDLVRGRRGTPQPGRDLLETVELLWSP